ncbi:hypothetical protein KJ628_00625 [Patescibacteria group bacterium]|nr:hypothetical protein [Patescibacteria group bacterium]
MTITLAQIGNSQGIRIPQAILREIKFVDQAKMTIKNGQIIIAPTKKIRKNWNQEFKKFRDDQNKLPLLPSAMDHSWDKEEWQW